MKRYRIISELGKGATGVVFRAVRSVDGSTVALKKLVVPGHLDVNEERDFIKRFKIEAEAALSLNHPGIVKCIDCGLDEGTFYIAYELIEGVTLDEALAAGRIFTVEETADILSQTSSALAHAHENGVVHRDISPGNIFIGDVGKVMISDFGVADVKTRDTLSTGSGDIVGTPGYMSPEQISGGDADPRSDIFSLGTVIYELLTGSPAFFGENIPQIINKVINTQPPPIREINPKVPVDLEKLVFRMLAKNIDYRYQGMGEVEIAVHRILEMLPREKKASHVGDDIHDPTLVCTAGAYDGSKFVLQPTVTTIGRTLGDILLSKDEMVTSQHAWITKEETGWFLYDADSESGTYLNGEKIEREEIVPGDRIRIGDTVLEFRGAGGHKGIFQDDDEPAAAGAATTELAKPKKVPWTIILAVLVPGIIVISALVYLGMILPNQYRAVLNDATNERWDNAFSGILDTEIKSVAWAQDIISILDDWDDSDLGVPEDYFPPSYIFGGNEIKADVQFRFILFQLAEDFFETVSSQPAEESQLVIPRSSVGVIELRVDRLEVPAGTDKLWAGRRNQLLGIVRTWQRAGDPNVSVGTSPQGFREERSAAKQHLLTGWYAFEDAGDNYMLLENAFIEFNEAWDEIAPVLDAYPNDEGGKAIAGMSAFLAAKVLRQIGNNNDIQPWQRGLVVLDEAEEMLQGVSQDAWTNFMPLSNVADFRSRSSVQAQINALRLSLESLLSQSGSE